MKKILFPILLTTILAILFFFYWHDTPPKNQSQPTTPTNTTKKLSLDQLQSKLCLSCKEGNTKEVVLLLVDQRINVNKRSKGLAPLFIACSHGRKEIVELLLADQRTKPNKCSYEYFFDLGLFKVYFNSLVVVYQTMIKRPLSSDEWDNFSAIWDLLESKGGVVQGTLYFSWLGKYEKPAPRPFSDRSSAKNHE